MHTRQQSRQQQVILNTTMIFNKQPGEAYLRLKKIIVKFHAKRSHDDDRWTCWRTIIMMKNWRISDRLEDHLEEDHHTETEIGIEIEIIMKLETEIVLSGNRISDNHVTLT